MHAEYHEKLKNSGQGHWSQEERELQVYEPSSSGCAADVPVFQREERPVLRGLSVARPIHLRQGHVL